jgi:Tol biopolymer transport system component
VYVVDISERLPRKLVSNLPDMLVPSWSHDGKWIYFQSNGKIFRCRAAGGDAVQLSTNSGATTQKVIEPAYLFPSESNDGKTLYFADQKPSIRMISLQTPGAESVLEGMPAPANESLWTVVPKGIYFVPAAVPKSLRFFDFATREVRPAFEVSKRFEQILSVSPDGRWIL